MSADAIQAIEQQFASKDAPVAEKAPVIETPEVPVVVETDEPVEAASTEGADVDENGKKRPGVHNRINELTKARRDAEREAEFWRQQALKTTPQQAPTQPTQVEAKPEAKTLESFGWDQEKYLDYLADQKAEAAIARREEAQRQQAAQAEGAKRTQSYQERVAKFQEAHPDIDFVNEVANAPLAISPPMAEYIIESDIGPEMGVYFRDNPEEAKAIFHLNPRQTDKAMAKIEAKLSTAPAEPAIPNQPVQITRAPPVASRVSASAAGKKSESRMTMEDEVAAVRVQRNQT